ncbi:BrnA antitoxin family protein [Rahnella aceris]|uniref:BrnA antitoxin family protein n=1 Tax=Rahnella sp. (strain Y9602) TaxID=2703885 RepID=UPI003FD4CF17
MPKLKSNITLPTDLEDAKIREAVRSDPDARLLEDDSVKLVPFSQLKAARKKGRPASESPKVAINIRYSQDVVEAFRSTGNGWQTRMDAALKDWLKHHAPDDVEIG